MPDILNGEQLTKLVEAIMTVDVSDGCRQGRLKFVYDHMGEDWMQVAEVVGRNVEVYVVVVAHTNEDQYGRVSEQDLIDAIYNCAPDAEVYSTRQDLKPTSIPRDVAEAAVAGMRGFIR